MLSAMSRFTLPTLTLHGTNENTNGLLREFLPKGSDFALVLPDTIDRFIFLLNLCPRKCLACRSRLRYFSRRCCT